MSSGRFQFASGNLGKLLALPKYVLSLLFSICVPRVRNQWVFGSGIGVGEGALAVALTLQAQQPEAKIFWIVADSDEEKVATKHGFLPVLRHGWRGYWTTLRAQTLVVTHGLGDANRFGVFGASIIQLWHGAPLKRIHLDSPVTTTFPGPKPIQALLRRMYEHGSKQVSLYVAGSVEAADRLRSAFRVAPGKVRVLGDPRDDLLALQASDPEQAATARASVIQALSGSPEFHSEARIILYAPTWRDGEVDPAIPSETEIAALHVALSECDAHLVIRSHPLGLGDYDRVLGDRVHLLGSDRVRDITPVLGAFDAVITDYSSIAIDFSLTSRPIVWFAPDLVSYATGRGLYEPLEITANGAIEQSWAGVVDRLKAVLMEHSYERRESIRSTRMLAARFHEHTDGDSAQRVLAAVAELTRPSRDLVPTGAVFFESYYGRQVSCNPLALDRKIAERYPDTPRFWSVISERQTVPEGATPVLVGSQRWFAARRHAQLLIVNDWLRYGYRRRRGQTVLQTWHGTMLKHLALGRPNVSLRTRLAIRRESRRWSIMLSQNPHSTEQFRSSYAFTGEVLETGYPRDDRLAQAVVGDERNPVVVSAARAALEVPPGVRVLAYAPTWRDHGVSVVDELDVHALAAELGENWVIVARGHTRTHTLGGYGIGNDRVIDASKHPDINDVILAADMVVTDYSSLMFDAVVARVPLAFFVPDLEQYRDRERGFTFDFEREAPGPLMKTRGEVVACAREISESGDSAAWIREHQNAYDAWRERFTPNDDGRAAARVVDQLERLGAFTRTD
ncbi:MAG: CDP-glycerol glycerophosphotransferase family protein [Leucobacter sp.]